MLYMIPVFVPLVRAGYPSGFRGFDAHSLFAL